jgi:hypothetical protein
MFLPAFGLDLAGSFSGLLAYIDPGTGSLLFQALVAGFLGAVIGFRNLRSWIALQFSKLFGRGRSTTAETPAAGEAAPSRLPADPADRS